MSHKILLKYITFKVGKMPANMSIFRAGGIYRYIPAFTGKYRQIPEN